MAAPEERYFVVLRQLFLRLSHEWQLLSVLADRHEQMAVWLLVKAGFVEVTYTGRAWTNRSSVTFSLCAWGNWREQGGQAPQLMQKLKSAVPAWKDEHVAAQLDDTFRIRLRLTGEQLQKEVAADPEWMAEVFFAYLGTQSVAARLALRILTHSSDTPGAVREDRLVERLDTLIEMQKSGTKAVSDIADNVSTLVKGPAQASPPAPKPTDHESRPDGKEPSVAVATDFGIHIDESTFTVTHGRKSLHFGSRSKLLFSILVRVGRRPGQQVPFGSLVGAGGVWSEYDVEASTIKGAVSRLKKNLRDAGLKKLAKGLRTGQYKGDGFIVLNPDSCPSGKAH